uniref:2-carboxy-D-arabinitol-1-phosphatase n=1 Tax=Oryza nivara TaxID=4536 RepID=A0A0E0FLY6_ORYNI
MLLLAPSPAAAAAAARRRKVGGSALRVRCSSVRELERSPNPRPGERLPPLREAKRVVLVRHGQSTWNAEGRIQGSSDISVLTPKGESQAETSRLMLLSDSFDACFTSPLARSRRTAEIIWADRDDDLIPDSDLREIDLYSFQGLLKNEGKERYGVIYRQWQKNAANFSIDGHYPVRELWDRAQNCWERILAHEGKSVLVVAHNAVNQALVASSLGLGTEYFRILLQSNCGASVLDFTPQAGGGPPAVCLNRLNQTPNSPVASGSSAGRKTSKRIILACQGATQNSAEIGVSGMGYAPLNMLGIIQSQKTAELLLDQKVNGILCSPQVAAFDTATTICEVQEAADCLGADCVPRYVEMKKLLELEIDDAFQTKQKSFGEIAQSGWLGSMEYKTLEGLWNQSKAAWQALLNELQDDTSERILVVVGHPGINLALICRCLDLTMDYMSSFHLDDGSISVIDFPDGPKGRGVPAGCLPREHVAFASSILSPRSLASSMLIPAAAVSLIQCATFGLLAAAGTIAVLSAARVRHWVIESMIRAEAVSVNEITIASTAQTYMIKGRPWLSLCHKKTGLIRLLLQSRAASVQTIFHGQRAWYAA